MVGDWIDGIGDRKSTALPLMVGGNQGLLPSACFVFCSEAGMPLHWKLLGVRVGYAGCAIRRPLG